MSYLVHSRTAVRDTKRLYDFLAQYDPAVADRGLNSIKNAVNGLLSNPTLGTPIPDRPFVRKIVVSFGASGYLIFHKQYEHLEKTLISRILHQKEWYDYRTIGLEEERRQETYQ